MAVMLAGCGAVEGSDDAGVVTDAGQMVVDSEADDAGMEVVDAGMMTMDAGMQCTPDTWSNFGEGFFQSTCSGCHPVFSNVANVRARRPEITSRIETGNMPQGRTLTTAQKDRVLEWLGCGAP